MVRGAVPANLTVLASDAFCEGGVLSPVYQYSISLPVGELPTIMNL